MYNRKTIYKLIAQIYHNTLALSTTTILTGSQFILPSYFFLLPSSFLIEMHPKIELVESIFEPNRQWDKGHVFA